MPAYTGTTFIETSLIDADTRHQASSEAIGRGTLMALAPGEGILAHRYANGTLHGYIALNRSEAWINAIDFSEPAAGLARRRRVQGPGRAAAGTLVELFISTV